MLPLLSCRKEFIRSAEIYESFAQRVVQLEIMLWNENPSLLNKRVSVLRKTGDTHNQILLAPSFRFTCPPHQQTVRLTFETLTFLRNHKVLCRVNFYPESSSFGTDLSFQKLALKASNCAVRMVWQT